MLTEKGKTTANLFLFFPGSSESVNLSNLSSLNRHPAIHESHFIAHQQRGPTIVQPTNHT